MAKYADSSGATIEVGNPELNPDLIAGRTIVPEGASVGTPQTPTTPTPPASTTVGASPTTPPAPASPQAAGTAAEKAATTGALTMPANGSVVDLLSMAGEDSSYANREQLAAKYGIQGYRGTAEQNQALSKKFLDAYNSLKTTQVPDTGAQASTALSTFLQDTPTVEQEDPQQKFMDSFASMNPVVANIYGNINNILSSLNTKSSLVEEFKQLYTDEYNPIATELMDINRIMDGTEDDIRAEITNAGGFATESQVQALTSARNKTLLKRASQLSDQLALKQDYINQIIDLTGEDRAVVERGVDRALGLANSMANMQLQMDNAARGNYESLLDTVGYKGLIDVLDGNKAQQEEAERLLGLPKGALAPGSSLSAYGSTEDPQLYGSADSGYFTYENGQLVPVPVQGGGSTKPGTSEYKFTTSQKNNGAATAGLSLSEFSGLPPDVQNLYINNSTVAEDLEGIISDFDDGSLTLEDARIEIDATNVTPAVKEFFYQMLSSKNPMVESETPLESTLFGQTVNTLGGIVSPTNWYRGVKNILGL